jgi:hypothetical protein
MSKLPATVGIIGWMLVLPICTVLAFWLSGPEQSFVNLRLAAPAWNTIGILMSLIGVLLLFRFGMPYHVPTGGAQFIITEQVDENDILKEAKYMRYGYLGLGLTVFGSLMQIYASWH